MASYHVDFKPSVYKDFRRLPEPVVERVMKRIEQLKDEPLPHGVEKLETAERLYRIRIGDYRIVYEVEMPVRQVMIHYVRHRREAYRAL